MLWTGSRGCHEWCTEREHPRHDRGQLGGGDGRPATTPGYAHSSPADLDQGEEDARGTVTIDVGSSRQLLIDDRFIAEVRDVALTM